MSAAPSAEMEARVHAAMRRSCDSIKPDEWCVQTGHCDCQIMLDLLAAAQSRPSSSIRREALEEAYKAGMLHAAQICRNFGRASAAKFEIEALAADPIAIRALANDGKALAVKDDGHDPVNAQGGDGNT